MCQVCLRNIFNTIYLFFDKGRGGEKRFVWGWEVDFESSLKGI